MPFLSVFEAEGTICSGIGLNYAVTPKTRLPGNPRGAGVIWNVPALKHSILKPTAQPAERELRRGIERWENEGGRLLARVSRDSEGGDDFAHPGSYTTRRPKAEFPFPASGY